MKYKPMLAYPVSSKPIDYSKLVYMQPKLDGVRCLIQYDVPRNQPHFSGKVTAYSRTGKVWKNIDHILKELKPFFIDNPNVVLDGELYNHDFRDDFESIISMVRKTKPTDEDRRISALNVQFHCYDIVNKRMKFSTRSKWLAGNLPDSYCVKKVETKVVDKSKYLLTTGDVIAKSKHTQNLLDGYEGSIVRLDTPYQCKRSHSLRKFKDFEDAEANIVGYEEGKGKRAGTLGKFIMQDDDGNQFGCPPGKGHNYKDLAIILKNIHLYMGQRATFTFFERTKAGSYRHPLFKCIRNYE
jgi:ATP-dependent DNA ligase